MSVFIAFIVIVAALLGTAIGSFLNVVAYRLPRRISLLRESRCGHCRSRIRWYQNIPVVSWLVLNGKCAVCWDRIPARDFFVELVSGVLFALVALGVVFASPADARPVDGALWVGTPEFWGILITLEVFMSLSIVLTLIDLDTKKLPNVIVLPGWISVVVLLLITTVVAGLWTPAMPVADAENSGPSTGSGAQVLTSPGSQTTFDWEPLIRAIIGGLALFLFYFLLRSISPRGMGGGDVKLAGLVGTLLGWFGWGSLFVGAFAAFALSGVFGLALIAMRRGNGKTAIPFGPWILAGAWVGIIAGDLLGRWYLGLYS